MEDANLLTTAEYAQRFQRADADWLDRSGFRFNRNHWYRVWKSGDGKRKRSDRQIARVGAFCFDIDHAGRSRQKAGLMPEVGFERVEPEGELSRPVATSVLLNCIRRLDPRALKLLTYEEARNLANHDGIPLPSQVSDPGIFQRPGSRLVIEFDGSSFWGAWLAI